MCCSNFWVLHTKELILYFCNICLVHETATQQIWHFPVEKYRSCDDAKIYDQNNKRKNCKVANVDGLPQYLGIWNPSTTTDTGIYYYLMLGRIQTNGRQNHFKPAINKEEKSTSPNIEETTYIFHRRKSYWMITPEQTDSSLLHTEIKELPSRWHLISENGQRKIEERKIRQYVSFDL